MKIECTTCDGSGKVHSHNNKCWGCDGKGFINDEKKVNIMGISPFNRNCDFSDTVFQNLEDEMPAPNPCNFEIIKTVQVGFHLVAYINYPDCDNYEGNKICIFPYTTEEQLRKAKEIDPHFSEQMESPFARFKPTQYGWKIAIEAAKLID